MNPSGTRVLLALLLLAVAVAFGWWIVRPLTHPPHVFRHRVAVAPHAEVTPVSATASPSPSLSPSQTPLPAPSASGGARLAIIIDDAGQWPATERALIALPIPLTLSVLPDVRYGHVIAREAADAGKGVMLHLPMEPISGIDPGPGKVTTEMTDAQIEAQVDADLADVPLAQGVNNHEGSKATADPRVMHDVAKALAAHGGLFFVDSLTIGDSVAAAEARAAGLPTASRDVFLDDRADVGYVEGQLRDAARIARRNGSAIAIGHPRPATLAAIRALIPSLQASGIRFVLVSQLLSPPVQP